MNIKVNNEKIGIIAGGTGGHIFGALALGEYINNEESLSNWRVQYITGTRPLDYQLFKNIPVENIMHFQGTALKGKKISGIFFSFFSNLIVLYKSFIYLRKNNFTHLIGLGGHICGPVMLAGFLQKIPLYIVEQNSVMGLTNKILSFISKIIFTHFPETIGLTEGMKKKVIVSGNPVRREFIENLKNDRVSCDNSINLLVFGGSLGAREINQLVFDFLENKNINTNINTNINILHQVGKNSIHPLIPTTINYIQKEFIDEMLEAYNWADLIISRSGASSVSELYYVNKPVIFIPYPLHKDRHQWLNAQFYKDRTKQLTYIYSAKQLSENSQEKLIHIISEVIENKNKIHECIINNVDLIPQKIIINNLI